jgi:nitroreductase
MAIVSKDAVLQQLRWRYSVRKFDRDRMIPAADWQALEDAVVLAPSSFGLQPWRFIVVSDPARREQLVAASWGQRQVADASHLIVFAVRKGLSAADVDRYVARIAEVRQAKVETFTRYRDNMAKFVAQPPEKFDLDAWSARQVYIALGFFISTAAMLGIDTSPMEGLDPARYDEILDLGPLGLTTLCACPAGYRAADDKYATLPKVRFAPADLFVRR